MTNNANEVRNMYFGTTVGARSKHLHKLFEALFEKAQKEIKGPAWPQGYIVDVACCEDFDSMKFKYKIRKIYPVPSGAQLALLTSDEGFTVPVVAQDEMEAMKLAMQVMDKYAEEYNGNI